MWAHRGGISRDMKFNVDIVNQMSILLNLFVEKNVLFVIDMNILKRSEILLSQFLILLLTDG